MDSCEINVERDSVCMGDDFDAPHSYNFKLSLNASIDDVFTHLKSEHYLPSVAGNNHSWDAIIDGKSIAIFNGNKQSSEASIYLSSKVSKFTVNGIVRMSFQYNSATT